MSITIQLRRDTKANWIESEAVLAPGEPGFETDTGKFKIGDGERRWQDLGYFNPGDDSTLFAAIDAHFQSLEATNIDEAAIHAAVIAQISELQSTVGISDDGPSLFLLYQNAKV